MLTAGQKIQREPNQVDTFKKRSQSVFAAYLNASPSTVQKWESDQKKPNGAFLKLLGLVDQKGLDVLT